MVNVLTTYGPGIVALIGIEVVTTYIIGTWSSVFSREVVILKDGLIGQVSVISIIPPILRLYRDTAP